MGVHEKEKLESALHRAGAQWRDEDLADILALLDKDYTKPQSGPEEEEPEWMLPEQKSVISVLPQQLKMEAEEIAPPISAAVLPDISNNPAASEAGPYPEAAEFWQLPPMPAPAGELPDFTDTPEKPRSKPPLALIILGVVEAAALVGVVLWWLKWIG